MADAPAPLSIEAVGLSVEVETRIKLATLRFFERDGAFAKTVSSLVGIALPDIGRAQDGGGSLRSRILAWRGPTETTLIGGDDELIDSLQRAVANSGEGCVVDQSAGAWIFRVSGTAVQGLFARLGGQNTMPSLGESRRSRLADVPVYSLKVRPEDTLLIVDRTYGAHLLALIRATAEDFGVPLFDEPA